MQFTLKKRKNILLQKKQFWIVLRKFLAKSVEKITVGQVMGWSRS